MCFKLYFSFIIIVVFGLGIKWLILLASCASYLVWLFAAYQLLYLPATILASLLASYLASSASLPACQLAILPNCLLVHHLKERSKN